MKQFQINFHKKSLSNSRDAQKAGSVRLQAFESQSKVGKRAPNAINATDATFSSSKLRVSSQHHSDNTSSDPNSNSKTQLYYPLQPLQPFPGPSPGPEWQTPPSPIGNVEETYQARFSSFLNIIPDPLDSNESCEPAPFAGSNSRNNPLRFRANSL